ncbi:MAG TPA: regulatory protein RecX [Gammaproteobacteria bacterium]|nr:regulatory protein RecX [Gammaproteobacteria bacterium]
MQLINNSNKPDGPDRDPLHDAEACAIRLLARREHSELEIERKLTLRGYEPEITAQILAKLVKAGHLSNERYAEQYVRLRGEKGYGPQRICIELSGRGLSDSQIEQAMLEDQTDWYATAQRAYHKKYGYMPPEDYLERSKRMRFMQYRGFESDHIQSVMEP